MGYYELVQQVHRALADAPDVIVEPRFGIMPLVEWLTAAFILEDREKEVKKRGSA